VINAGLVSCGKDGIFYKALRTFLSTTRGECPACRSIGPFARRRGFFYRHTCEGRYPLPCRSVGADIIRPLVSAQNQAGFLSPCHCENPLSSRPPRRRGAAIHSPCHRERSAAIHLSAKMIVGFYPNRGSPRYVRD